MNRQGSSIEPGSWRTIIIDGGDKECPTSRAELFQVEVLMDGQLKNVHCSGRSFLTLVKKRKLFGRLSLLEKMDGGNI